MQPCNGTKWTSLDVVAIATKRRNAIAMGSPPSTYVFLPLSTIVATLREQSVPHIPKSCQGNASFYPEKSLNIFTPIFNFIQFYCKFISITKYLFENQILTYLLRVMRLTIHLFHFTQRANNQKYISFRADTT